MLPMPTNCHSNRPIEIYKGDDSGAFAVRKIRITLTTPIKMFGATAEFSLLSYRKTFTDAEIAANAMEIEFSSEVTKNFPLGICFGSFKVVDVTGMTLTMTSRIPFLVKLPGSDNAVLSGGVSIPVCDRHDGRVVIPSDVSTIKIQYETSYNQLTDKPTINGVTVSGDKTLQDYGMASAAELAAEKARAEGAERELSEGKVDKEEGKGLSSNDFTDAEKAKLGGIEEGAQKNLPWSETIPAGGIPRADLSRDVKASLTRADNAASKAELEALDDVKADWGTKLADYRITDAYTKAQVDEKLERSEAHYLTKRVVVEGGYEFAPFDTIDELEECLRTHEEKTNPKFFYAGQAHTPDKNDYCVVLSDRTHNSATARYMFVGVFDEGGEFQYQYSISQTAFTPEQWATITGGPYLKLTSATQQTVSSDVRVTGTLTVDKNLDIEDGGLVERKALAEDFDATKTYAVGEFVFYLGDLYECVAEVTTPGAWTYDANWKKINLKDVAQSGGSVGQSPFRSLSKVSDYLYEAVYGTLDEKTADAYMREHFADIAASLGACTSVSVGKFFGRNYDWKYDDSVTFAVRTAATGSRHAVVSVCRSPFGVTKAKVESGDVDYLTWCVLPYLALDGINDAGVVVSMNVVPGKEGGSPWTGTDVCAVAAVRYALDNAATAQEAANLIATKVWMPAPEKMGGYAVHYLVCDGTKKFIVEDGVAHDVSDDAKVGITNFRVKTGDEFLTEDIVDLDKLAAFEPYGMGVERYDAILALVPGTITSSASMDAFMRSLCFSECYEENGYGGSKRPSEFAGLNIDDPETRVKVNETDKIQNWFISENIHASWVSRTRNGEFWQTVHSTTYDIGNLSLRIGTQESSENEYEASVLNMQQSSKVVELYKDGSANRLVLLDGVGNRTNKVYMSFSEFFGLVRTGRACVYYHAVGDTGRKALYHPNMADDKASPKPIIVFDATGTLGGRVYTRSIAVEKVGDDGIAVTIGALTEIAKSADVPTVTTTIAESSSGKAADAAAVKKELVGKLDARTQFSRVVIDREFHGGIGIGAKLENGRLIISFGGVERYADIEYPWSGTERIERGHVTYGIDGDTKDAEITEAYLNNDAIDFVVRINDSEDLSGRMSIYSGAENSERLGGETLADLKDDIADATKDKRDKTDLDVVASIRAWDFGPWLEKMPSFPATRAVFFVLEGGGVWYKLCAIDGDYSQMVGMHNATFQTKEEAEAYESFTPTNTGFVYGALEGVTISIRNFETTDRLALASEVPTKDDITEIAEASAKYKLVTIGADGNLTDRAINATSAASVTVPDDYTDLLIRATVTGSLVVTMPDGVTVYGDDFPAESGEYLVTITKIKDGEAFVKTLTMEVPNA